MKYNVIFLSQVIHAKLDTITRPYLLLDIYKDIPRPTSKYVYASNIGIPVGGFLVLPIFNDDEIQTYTEGLRKWVKGIELETLIITNVIVGSLCYRKFDNHYSRQYRLLVEEYRKLKPEKVIDYGIKQGL